MAEKNTIFKQKIKQKGFFSYSDFYTFCFDWLKDNGYNVQEKEYIEKNSPGGKEIQLDWEGGKKVTDYFKNTIPIKIRIIGLTDVEAEQNGQKIKTNKGDLSMEVSGVLVRDYDEQWEGKPMHKFMRGIYDKYIIKTTMDEYEGRLIGDCAEFVSQVKAFLQMGK